MSSWTKVWWVTSNIQRSSWAWVGSSPKTSR